MRGAVQAVKGNHMTKRFIRTIILAAGIVASLLFGMGCAAQPSTQFPNSSHETGSVQANGITIAYETFGPSERETILLIGGTGQQLIDWPPEFIQELVRRGYRVVI